MNHNHRRILKTLNDASFAAYIVGGSVRDHLLNRKAKDVDITTSARPEQVAALFGYTEFVGAHFGISLVKCEDGETIEVATFRTDGCYKDSRHPEKVEYTNDVRDDLARRDFTIGALLMDRDGTILDHVGGLDDLHKGLIRTVGDPTRRFKEDALRMLRAVRFACTLGFCIEAATFDGITACASRISLISAERIAGELEKILTSGRAALGIELMDRAGLLGYILPELLELKNCPQSAIHHPEGDVFVHTLGLLKQLEEGCSLTLALGALLHDIGKPAALAFKEDGEPTAYGHEELGEPIARAILSRLKFSNEVIGVVTSHVRQHMNFRELPNMRIAKQLRFIGQPNFRELLELHRIDSMSGRGHLTNHAYAKKLADETPEAKLHPVRFITGRDLIDLGMRPGPRFREILEKAETMQLEGTLKTREQALDHFSAIYKIEVELAGFGLGPHKEEETTDGSENTE